MSRISRALISVSNKDNLLPLARFLSEYDVSIISTGGTRLLLESAKIPDVQDVENITNFPEILDGRVKTLHPAVYGGLLAIPENPEHDAALKKHALSLIDLVIVNLYPFERVAAEKRPFEDVIEHIDVGGPSMLRAAAKNFQRVVVISSPEDYAELMDELRENDGATTYAFRLRMAQKAFRRVSAYDAVISTWLAKDDDARELPKYAVAGGELFLPMRYGENKHLRAGFYRAYDPQDQKGLGTLVQHSGKAPSYNNLLDCDAAFNLTCEFPSDTPIVAIIKHATPCGVACGRSLLDAYEKALACDPLSAFGGVIALNHTLDLETARKMTEIFIEVIIAPDVDEAAIAHIKTKKNIRLLTTGGLRDPRAKGWERRTLGGGFLLQERDAANVDDMTLKVVTKRAPTDQDVENLKFGFRVVKHTRSNAIVYVQNKAAVGIGAGQTSRIDSVRIATWKVQEHGKENASHPLIMASDAFFPFRDGLVEAVKAGVKAVIQPGGSINDKDIIAAADECDVAMVFTDVRHFKH